MDERTVTIIYKNYRGETRERHIVPERLWYGATDWHPEPQWVMDALDVEKGEVRSFAMQDIQRWQNGTVGLDEEECRPRETVTPEQAAAFMAMVRTFPHPAEVERRAVYTEDELG